MTHSIQMVGEKSLILRDDDLWVLVALIREMLEGESHSYKRLRPTIEAWREQMRNYTPGAIELDLDTVVASMESKNELLALFAALKERMVSLVEIPKEKLIALCEAPGVIHYDGFPASSVVKTIEQLSELIVTSHVSPQI